MPKKFRAILIAIAVLVGAMLAIQIPLSSSVDRFIVNHLEVDSTAIPRTTTGRVDFIRIVDEMSFVPTKENMLAGMISVVGPDDPVDSEKGQQFLADLNISIQGDVIEDVQSYLEAATQDDEDEDAVWKLRDKLSSPWSQEDVPAAFEWLEKYTEQIDRLVDAASRPGFYHPHKRESEDETLFSVFISGVIQLREAARVLSYRANFHLGNNDIDAAITDLNAIYEIGHTTQQGGSLLQRLVGMAITGISFNLFQNVLEQPELTTQHIQRLSQGYYTHLPEPLLDPIRHYEFYAVLDSIQQCERGDCRTVLGLDHDFGLSETSFNELQARLVFSRFTNWELAAHSLWQRNLQMQQISIVENDKRRMAKWSEFQNEMNDGINSLLRVIAGSRSRGYLAGEMLTCSMLPSIASLERSNIKQRVHFDLTKIALAIESFRLTNNSYPNDLEDLVPEYLESLPTDRFTDRPLIFQMNDNHYFVASTGADETSELQLFLDDVPEGVSHNTSDDVVLKLPIKK